ncbi:hypothetical protein IB279_13700 [Ensifer sp. ENS06]|uniref:RHS repeat-associated core domain-containing protein n=1 Tax=Ensifer sp. ENS06 TaxID=2769276 RepID=UPI00177C3005|nr:RHS repeat-associated core domain-containing protein [Ensifer sp. ENS06]MBD9623997.1 hypothetical protein [Ensifer sp. ENS06]
MSLSIPFNRAQPTAKFSQGRSLMALLRSVLTRLLSILLIATLTMTPLASAANARFISPDTLDPTLEGVGTNRYAYAANDPINNSDPNGHLWGAVIGGVIGVLGSWLGGWDRANAPANSADARTRSGTDVAIGMVVGAGGSPAARLVGGAFKDTFEKKQVNKQLSETAEAAAASKEWNPTTDAGPLPQDIAETFRSATYTETVTTEPTTLYRVYGGKAGEIGGYWTRTAPKGPLQSVVDSALDQHWKNTATNVARIRVPSGTRLFEGVAAPQRGLVGGGNQIYIRNVDPSWLIR